jgi:ubiquinone/menaquinone biosynthesis C-methylase UbiE/DNA-binding transcriptional ArsR family regulator
VTPARSSPETLQKVFKTFADPTRVRILVLLEREELAVQELMDVLGMAQSRVSRHLAILREAGLLHDRRDGTYVFYRFAPPSEGPWRDAWNLVTRSVRDTPTTERDVAALERVLGARAARTRSFFESVGPEWDALRKVFNDDALRAQAIARLVDPDRTVADIGTGTGILATELARLGMRVIAIDNSSRMLDATRAKIERAGITGIELRQGEAGALPLADGEVDAAFAHMVLHYLPSPGEAIREMARAVKPRGTVVVVDFVRHQLEWMRDELGVTWLGFAPEEVESWFGDAGLVELRREEHAGTAAGRDLPATFIASARVPA